MTKTMKSCVLVLFFVSSCGGTPEVPREQYTPDKSDWSTFYDKAVSGEDAKNTDHSPDGVHWIDRNEWLPWDGNVISPLDYSKSELKNMICPGSTVRGLYELFDETQPFADVVNPTKAEVDYWHATAVNHVRAMVGYTEEQYIIKPDKCLHLRALWSDEKFRTRKWDTADYPERCEFSTNPHCGEGFMPSVADQQEYLPEGITSCPKKAGSAGLFSAAKSNIPWSIKWIRPFCATLGGEGFWGGHTGPWFHRSEFGWGWWDTDPSNFNSNAGLRTKWSGDSGPVKYENPDITSGKNKVLVDNVNPNPRFPGFECDGINWLGGKNNATECYYTVMGLENECGKRFMTYNTANNGCGCYSPNMAVCATKGVSGRLTWDFEPVVSSFDGLYIDIDESLSQNSLPYTGRVCPQINWMQGGGGDASHCLQKMIENIDGLFDDCGRNFVTFNAAGGCACYPPDQTTCHKSETSRQSGRSTYELKVDPSYNPPTTSPPTTSGKPSGSPTSAPKFDQPSSAPTSSSSDTVMYIASIKITVKTVSNGEKFKPKVIVAVKDIDKNALADVEITLRWEMTKRNGTFKADTTVATTKGNKGKAKKFKFPKVSVDGTLDLLFESMEKDGYQYNEDYNQKNKQSNSECRFFSPECLFITIGPNGPVYTR